MKKKKAFTLLEVLLSCLILAAGAVVICGLSRRCLENTVRGWEYEQAYRLADECLDKMVLQDLSRLDRGEIIKGNFGSRYPNYNYQLEIEPDSAEELYRVTAIVSWDVSGQKYKIKAVTLIYNWSG